MKSAALACLVTFFVSCASAPPAQSASAASAAMAMTNVYDAFGKPQEGLTQHFGFSALVQYGDTTVLFDAGTDARIFEKNVRTLNVDLRKVDIAIVSHGHYDHIGGFDVLIDANPSVRIYAPNDFFSLGAPTRFPFRQPDPDLVLALPEHERYFGGAKGVEGMVTVPTGRFWKSQVRYITAAEEIAPGILLVPTTSSLMGTFIKYPPFSDDRPHFAGLPELSVAFATPDGQVILAGCSHSTIETIVQETRKVKQGKIRAVAGGFHLIPYARTEIEGLAGRMRNEYGVETVSPAHCSGHVAFGVFRSVFGSGYRFWGLGETIRF